MVQNHFGPIEYRRTRHKFELDLGFRPGLDSESGIGPGSGTGPGPGYFMNFLNSKQYLGTL